MYTGGLLNPTRTVIVFYQVDRKSVGVNSFSVYKSHKWVRPCIYARSRFRNSWVTYGCLFTDAKVSTLS